MLKYFIYFKIEITSTWYKIQNVLKGTQLKVSLLPGVMFQTVVEIWVIQVYVFVKTQLCALKVFASHSKGKNSKWFEIWLMVFMLKALGVSEDVFTVYFEMFSK